MNGKDLINIGISSAIYFVIVFIIAMLGMIPIFLPLLSVLAVSVFTGLIGKRLMRRHFEKVGIA